MLTDRTEITANRLTEQRLLWRDIDMETEAENMEICDQSGKSIGPRDPRHVNARPSADVSGDHVWP